MDPEKSPYLDTFHVVLRLLDTCSRKDFFFQNVVPIDKQYESLPCGYRKFNANSFNGSWLKLP